MHIASSPKYCYCGKTLWLSNSTNIFISVRETVCLCSTRRIKMYNWNKCADDCVSIHVHTLICECCGSKCCGCLTFRVICIRGGQYCSSLHQHALTPALFNALLQFINAPSAINISAEETHRSHTDTYGAWSCQGESVKHNHRFHICLLSFKLHRETQTQTSRNKRDDKT